MVPYREPHGYRGSMQFRVPAFPCSRVPVVERVVASDEKGHPSPVLPGHRHLWLLRHHVCDRLHEEGHPRRDLFPLPSILHGATEVHRCRRSRSEVRQEIRAQSLAERRKGRRKKEEGKGKRGGLFPPLLSSLFLFPYRGNTRGSHQGARPHRGHLWQHVQREERGA